VEREQKSDWVESQNEGRKVRLKICGNLDLRARSQTGSQAKVKFRMGWEY
jgi:hypothetical protein